MKIIPLYRYTRADGGIDVSPIKPDADYTDLYRLVADEGKALTQDGIDTYMCIDTASAEGWFEVDYVEDETA